MESNKEYNRREFKCFAWFPTYVMKYNYKKLIWFKFYIKVQKYFNFPIFTNKFSWVTVDRLYIEKNEDKEWNDFLDQLLNPYLQ